MNAKKYYIYKDWVNGGGLRGWNPWYKFIEVDTETGCVNFYDYDFILDKSMTNIQSVDLKMAEEIDNPFYGYIYNFEDFIF